MKLAGLRLRVIWTLPVFYYLDFDKIEIKNCARSGERTCAFFRYCNPAASLLSERMVSFCCLQVTVKA